MTMTPIDNTQNTIEDLEHHFVQKLRNTYDGLITDLIQDHIDSIKTLPRHQQFSSFSSSQLNALQQLINHGSTLIVEIVLLDAEQQAVEIDLSQSPPFQVKAHPDWQIDHLKYNFSSGFIWVSIYFQDELKEICQSELPQKTMSIEKIIFACIFAAIFFTAALLFSDIQTLMTVCLVLSFLCLSFIYQHIRGHTKSKIEQDMKLTQLHISQYFSFHLGTYATEKLSLDDFSDDGDNT